MKGITRVTLFCLVAALMVAPQLWAQNPTGTLTGTVVDNSGAALPGVTVTATSPNLQGQRSTQTGGNGGYKLAFLPPGVYSITYELEGFKTAVKEVKISAAQTSVADVAMELGVVSEEIVVVGQQGNISETNTGASTVTGKRDRQAGDQPRRHLGGEPVGGRRRHRIRLVELALDLGRCDVREPVHDQRRVGEREHPRRCSQPVHRRRHPGDHHRGHRRLGRVRAVHRRRDQRHHQVGRQPVGRQLPHHLHQPGAGRP